MVILEKQVRSASKITFVLNSTLYNERDKIHGTTVTLLRSIVTLLEKAKAG